MPKKIDPFANLVLDAEEQQIEADIEAGLYQPVENMETALAEARQMAINTIESWKKTKQVTFRIAEPDLLALKEKAREEGLSYQSLLGSIIHKYNTGALVMADNGKRNYGVKVRKTNSKKIAGKKSK